MSSREVDNATGEAPAKVDVVQLLNEKRAALEAARKRYKLAKSWRDEEQMSVESRLIDALKDILVELERDASVVVEARGQKEAEARLVGIKRAAGSNRASHDADNKLRVQLEIELRKVNAKLTSWAREDEALQAEANGLTDRFDLPPLRLESIDEPSSIEIPAPWRHHIIRPNFEDCEHNLRQRRDYAEISGTDGFKIIMRTGLKPFRALTERESEVLVDSAKERKPDPVLAQAAVEANALGNLGVPGGSVARG